MSSDGFRCSASSLADGEPLAGTAPTDRAWLFVEYAGAWGRDAVAASRLPDEVKAALSVPGVRTQLIRESGRNTRATTRVIVAAFGESGTRVEAAELADPREVAELDLAALAGGGSAGLAADPDPVWLVCTNGSRDRCCAESGRPVAEALAREWPGQVWETTHLGGHRFAATMLALPSGLVLGRLDATEAIEATRAIAAGTTPTGRCRGRAGTAPPAQVAELHLRERLGLHGIDAVSVESVDGGQVTLSAGGEAWVVTVAGQDAPRRQSCGDPAVKSAVRWDILEVVAAG